MHFKTKQHIPRLRKKEVHDRPEEMARRGEEEGDGSGVENNKNPIF